MQNKRLHIANLGERRDLIPVLAEWFSQQWGDEYPEDRYAPAEERLTQHAQSSGVPFTVVGTLEGEAIATAAVLDTMESLKRDYGPWLGYVYVAPEFRHKGFGTSIVMAIEEVAGSFGIDQMYLNTGSQRTFYEVQGWRQFEMVDRHEVIMTKSNLIASNQEQELGA